MNFIFSPPTEAFMELRKVSGKPDLSHTGINRRSQTCIYAGPVCWLMVLQVRVTRAYKLPQQSSVAEWRICYNLSPIKTSVSMMQKTPRIGLTGFTKK